MTSPKALPMSIPLSEPEVRGVGTITNNATGEVVEIWIGAPPPAPNTPAINPEGTPLCQP